MTWFNSVRVYSPSASPLTFDEIKNEQSEIQSNIAPIHSHRNQSPSLVINHRIYMALIPNRRIFKIYRCIRSNPFRSTPALELPQFVPSLSRRKKEKQNKKPINIEPEVRADMDNARF